VALPFTVAHFLEVFAEYNQAVWPAQAALTVLGLIPLIWSLVGTTAALALGMREDFGLLLALRAVLAVQIRNWAAGRRRASA
jgi:hypothetical protein